MIGSVKITKGSLLTNTKHSYIIFKKAGYVCLALQRLLHRYSDFWPFCKKCARLCLHYPSVHVLTDKPMSKKPAENIVENREFTFIVFFFLLFWTKEKQLKSPSCYFVHAVILQQDEAFRDDVTDLSLLQRSSSRPSTRPTRSPPRNIRCQWPRVRRSDGYQLHWWGGKTGCDRFIKSY